ncbi:MAG: hypothetical protein U0R19_12160 [Bryobacteraceae bacterium]
MLGIVLTRLVIREFGGFGQLLRNVLGKTSVEADFRPRVLVWRFDLLDEIADRWRGPAEETHHHTDESDPRKVKCGVIAKAVGTALHLLDDNINIGWLGQVEKEIVAFLGGAKDMESIR